MYESISIAELFINLSLKEGRLITPMKLQKLIYFAHGFYLATYDRPLIKEQVQAWKYGPVINSIYHAFKNYGNTHITEVASTNLNVGRIKKEDQEFLITVWDLLKNYSAVELSNLTHVRKSPWDEVIEENGAIISNSLPISNDKIKGYFQREYVSA